jgi:hypothetical protein
MIGLGAGAAAARGSATHSADTDANRLAVFAALISPSGDAAFEFFTWPT